MAAKKKSSYRHLRVFVLIAIGLGLIYHFNDQGKVKVAGRIRVLAYSSFVHSWGPGPDLAKRFFEKTGVEVELIEASDAGVLLQKASVLKPDIVLGMDQMALREAQESNKWRPAPSVIQLPSAFQHSHFLPFDHAPLTFVYREGQWSPPSALADLLRPEFKKSLALQDPRTSSPGLQFYLWVLDQMGIEPGLEFLKNLRASVYAISPSWSSAYGVFTKGLAGSAWSYLTSPIYHEVEEKNSSFRAATFAIGHPIQIEYFGILEGAQNPEGAERFAAFLLTSEAQVIIMSKNYMLPIVQDVAVGTPFARVGTVPAYQWKNLENLVSQKRELLERWATIGF